jgi:Putative Ig domain
MPNTTIHITQWGIVVTLGGPFGTPLAVSCNSTPSGQYGVPYSHSFLASGGTPPYTFAIIAGSLPVGLSMSSAGVVTGTPLSTGAFPITIQVTDATSTTATVDCSILIEGIALAIAFRGVKRRQGDQCQTVPGSYGENEEIAPIKKRFKTGVLK